MKKYMIFIVGALLGLSGCVDLVCPGRLNGIPITSLKVREMRIRLLFRFIPDWVVIIFTTSTQK